MSDKSVTGAVAEQSDRNFRLRSSAGLSPGYFWSALWGSGRTASQTQQQGLSLKEKEREFNMNAMQILQILWNVVKGKNTPWIKLTYKVVSCIFLPMTANVPSRMPTADWIVGIPCNCLTGILQFPLTLQGHTVTKERREGRRDPQQFT